MPAPLLTTHAPASAWLAASSPLPHLLSASVPESEAWAAPAHSRASSANREAQGPERPLQPGSYTTASFTPAQTLSDPLTKGPSASLAPDLDHTNTVLDSNPAGTVPNGNPGDGDPSPPEWLPTIRPPVPHPPFHVVILTLMPQMYPGPLGVSLAGKALQAGLWRLNVIDLRAFGLGAYCGVDDTAYGGGAGMVIRPEVVDNGVRAALLHVKNPTFVYMTPRGAPLVQAHCAQWGQPGRELVVLCGRYEGVDERVLRYWNFIDLNLADCVLCGGDIPALALIEGCVRLLPGVLGNPQSTQTESFQKGLLEHPLYTRPAVWKGVPVPEVLVSGHHQKILRWQQDQSLAHTAAVRPDLLGPRAGCGDIPSPTPTPSSVPAFNLEGASHTS